MNHLRKILPIFLALAWAIAVFSPAQEPAPAPPAGVSAAPKAPGGAKKAAEKGKKRAAGAQKAAKNIPPTGEEIAKVEAAAPKEAPAKPQKPRKVLVFNLSRGFYHGSIPLCAETMRILGAKSGAFEATLSDDIHMFLPDKLNQFDAVCMNNTTGDLFRPPDFKSLPADQQEAATKLDAEIKKSFVEFVRGGKGLIGIHAATDCLYQWADYGDMMGGYFSGHPWNEEVGVKIDDPKSPLTAMFHGQGFMVTDEIYMFRDPYSREKLHELLSIDTAKTNMNKGDKIKRTDGDFAVSWIKPYGQGRVFYCSLGHRNEIFWTPAILEHYLAGIQYALGDLPADSSPSAGMNPGKPADPPAQAVPAADPAGGDPPAGDPPAAKSKRKSAAQSPSESTAPPPSMPIDEAWKEAAKYQFGQSRLCLSTIEDHLRKTGNSPADRAGAVKHLIALLGPETTEDCKDFACRQLSVLGSDEAVPALSGLLLDKKVVEIARYALERIPGPAADEALRSALGKTSGATKAGIINSISVRKDAQAVPLLIGLAGDADSVVAGAAIAALGRIGGPEAAKSLAEAQSKAPEPLRAGVAEARLVCAEGLQAQGQTSEAAAIYTDLYSPSQPKPIRVAAARGLMATDGARSVSLAVELLRGGEPDLQAVAAQFVRQSPGAEAVKAVAAELPQLSPEGQELALGALGDRGDPAAYPAVAEAARSADERVRGAALQALGRLGNASAIPTLAEAASKGKGAEQEIARQSLARLQGPGVDQAMLAGLEKSDPAARAELIRAEAARGDAQAVPALLKSAKDPDPAVRLESLKALGSLAPADSLPELVELLTAAQPEERQAAEDAVVSAGRKSGAPADAKAAPVLAALASAKDPGLRISLLAVLGRLGGPKALEAVRAASKETDEEVKQGAVRALAGWPDAAPMDDLAEIARTAPKETLRVLALRGYIRMIGLPGDRPAEKTLQMYKDAMALAARDDEKRMILAGLADVKTPEALEVVAPYLDNEPLKAEAAAATVKIADGAQGAFKAQAQAALKKAAPLVKGKKPSKKSADAGQKTKSESTKKRGKTQRANP